MSQIEKDIRAWSRVELSKWAKDSVMRYEVGEVHDSVIMANLIGDLWTLSAFLLADADCTSLEAGMKFAEFLEGMRLKERKLHEQDSHVSES
jgi:hypothetical protein